MRPGAPTCLLLEKNLHCSLTTYAMLPPRRRARITGDTPGWPDCASFVRVYDASYSRPCPWWAGSCDTAAGKENGTMRKLQRFIGLVVVCGWLSGTGTVHADAVTDWHAIAVQALATMTPPRAIPLPTSISPSSKPPSMTRSRPLSDASNPTRRASLAPRAPRPPLPPQRRMLSSSPSSRTTPPRWTRPTRSTWPPTSSPRMTLACALARRRPPRCSPGGPTMGASPIPSQRPSSAARPRANGVRRPPATPRPRRPRRRWRCPGSVRCRPSR